MNPTTYLVTPDFAEDHILWFYYPDAAEWMGAYYPGATHFCFSAVCPTHNPTLQQPKEAS